MKSEIGVGGHEIQNWGAGHIFFSGGGGMKFGLGGGRGHDFFFSWVGEE